MPLRRATPLKKTTLVMTVSILTILMVLPVIGSVNTLAGKPTMIDRTLRADGAPLPPPIPPQSSSMEANVLVADGGPLPPFPPQPSSMEVNVLVADGGPLPPFPPQPSSMEVNVLVADGGPLPPLPPQPGSGLLI